MYPRFCMHAAAAALALSALAPAHALDIAIQTNQPPLQFTDAAPGGAHPLGGPIMAFVDQANAILGPRGIRFELHLSGNVNPADTATVKSALVPLKDFGTLHKAVALGAAKGGLNATAGIPADSKLAFGEMMSGGAPFGLEPDELFAFIYAGGGLELLQSFYDEKFDGALKIIPIGITSSQGPGFFKEALPDPDQNPSLTPVEAMASLCKRPIIIRWPETAAAVWTEACKRAGVTTVSIGKETRCKDSAKACGAAAEGNPVIHKPTVLTFGGFAPGVIPQTMFSNGNIDAYELNMPTEDVQFLKLSKKLQNKRDAEVDLRDVVPPFSYAGTWHQPTVFVELVINKAFWNGLEPNDRALIETVARSAVLTSFASRVNMQGEALRFLAQQGVTQLRWPQGLIDLLRAALPTAMAQESAEHAAAGDTTFGRMYDAMTTFQKSQAVFSDYGDINQGQARIPTSPRPR